jgi:hypothetical protein
MTPKQADKAIRSGKPVKVIPAYGEPFELLITSRDRRRVMGTYEWEGKTLEGTFERADLRLIY